MEYGRVSEGWARSGRCRTPAGSPPSTPIAMAMANPVDNDSEFR
jgi:hypothetical protein